MNRLKLTSVLLLCFESCALASTGEVNGRVLSYGILKSSGEMKSVEDRSTPTGKRWRVTDAIFTVSTNRVPAKIGLKFGIQYEISNLPIKNGKDVIVSVITKYPRITRPDGTTSQTVQRVGTRPTTNGRTVGTAGYGFEHDYELVPGKWEFEIIYRGKTVCRQEFIVFLE